MSKTCALAVIAALLFGACGLPATAGDREADRDAAAGGNNAFAFDLYRHLSTETGNLFFSPYSISAALAMTWAGARGTSEEQMAKVLHFTLSQEALHPAHGALKKSLEGRRIANRPRNDPASNEDAFELVTANALWGRKGLKFRGAFTGTLKSQYDSELRTLDFAGDPEGCRKTINAWAEKKTRDKIVDLLPPGVIDASTPLVLTNAIYFISPWEHPFRERATTSQPFHGADGKPVQVPTMRTVHGYPHLENDRVRMVVLPYAGEELSMVVIVPTIEGGPAALAKELAPEVLAGWLEEATKGDLDLYLPKFKVTSEFRLKSALMALGMTDPFATPAADFSGMTDTKEIFIGDVIHKAFVDVNEKGTEAAAATAVVMRLGGMPGKPKEFRVDRPFLFLIRDNPSGAILFLGHVTHPGN